MAARRKQSDEGEDPRYKNPKYKSRKVMRKAQRKSDKQRHHQNMIQWKQRRKQALGPKAVQKSQDDVKITKRKTLKTNDELASSADFPVEKSADQLEIEYLERQLLKNRKSGAKGGDLFQTLRKEFVNDGFDEDFLDFLSSIDHMAAKGKRTSVDSTSVAKRMKKGGATSKVEDSEEDEEDDSDSEEEEEYGVDEDEDGEEEGEQDDESQEEDDEDASDSESDTDQPSDEDELDEGTRTRKKVTFDLPKSKETRGIVGEKGTPPKDNAVKIDEETIESVKKQQIGLINRISEGNFTIVVKEMINVYNKMLSCESGEEQTEERLLAVDVLIEDLCDCTVRMVIENENTVVSLVAIHTALICALCNAVGINVGYVYCHKLLKSLEKALPILFKNKEGKQLSDAKLTARNSVMSFAVISHLEMLDLETLFFLIKNMSREEITEHLAQILMVVLRYTGHKMKSENPTSFHKIIEHLNKLIEQYKANHGDISQSRLRFFEQEVESFKLSKEKKPLETFDFLKNIIKGEFRYRGGAKNPQISHQTLLKFTKKLDTASLMAVKAAAEKDPNSTEALMQKAAALRLYSNCQKSTFVAIMGAISPKHAVERVMDLGIKSSQYTEVVYTIVHSMISEKLYNEYYTEVAKRLARLPSAAGKRFTRANVCTLIAIIEHLHEKKPRRCSHVGRFFAAMVTGKVLELRLLRFMKKEHVDTVPVETFLRSLFGFLVTHTPVDHEEHVIAQIMSLSNEEVFDILGELWEDYLQDHCMGKVLSNNSGKVVMEACRRIFRVKNND